MGNVRKGTLSDAIDSVSTLDIIESFDVPNRTRRGRTYILCPGHDDKHFGSCYVDKNDNGYYCYVCGEHVTKWQMVLKLNGNRKKEACNWFFDTSGITPTEENREDPYKKIIHLIRRLEKYIRNNNVYNDTYACAKIDSSYGRNIGGEYLYSELTITNPLLDMYKSSKSVFKKTVMQILNTEINKTSKMLAFYSNHPDDCLYVEGIGPVPYDDMKNACIEVINSIKSLMAEIDCL